MKISKQFILPIIPLFLFFIISSSTISCQNSQSENFSFEEIISIRSGEKAKPGTFHLIAIKSIEQKPYQGFEQILTLEELESLAIFAENKRLENETRYITISPFLQLVILPASIINSPNFQPNSNLYLD